MKTSTIELHRVIAAPPKKVYRAFTQPDALIRWMPPNGFTASIHHFDFKVGGHFKMSFHNFTTGNEIAFGGEYLEIVPAELLRYTDVFEDPELEGELEVTVTLRAVSCGTDLRIVQTGVPAVIPPEQCYLGWQQTLQHLATLVEPEICD